MKATETQILSAIRNHKEFRMSLIKEADKIIDKIYSYAQNPNCSCKRNILEWIKENPEKMDSIIEKHPEAFIEEEKPKPPPDINKNRQVTNPQNMSGEVVSIEPNPEAYKELINRYRAERKIYRGISVVIRDTEWLIFFF